MVINILSNRSEWTFYFLSSVQFNFTISENIFSHKKRTIPRDCSLVVKQCVTTVRRIIVFR
ncbi:hypothetical protein E6A54_02015 [Lactobacillus johnsonii]|nr:hypothetical protein E6A54_02015 [Lactobacillus johnsonii]